MDVSNTVDQAEIELFRARLQVEPVVATILRSPAQNALASIAQLQSDIPTTSTTINTVNLGPFSLGGSCDYDCFIGICVKTYHWSWNLDFSGIRPPLQQSVQQVSDAAGAFTSAFAPARDWLKNTLPQFSSDFAAQASTILATNAAIMQAGGVATAAQIATVQAAFADITAGLSNGQNQMAGAISAVAQFVNQLSAIEGELSPFLSSMQQSMNDSVTNTQNNFVNGMDCGQGDADNQINVAKAMFNTSVAIIQASFGTLANDTSAVDSATSQFVAALVTILDQYQNVAQQVTTAGSYPAGVIQDLHLDIAANEWTQLAQYAQTNIQ